LGDVDRARILLETSLTAMRRIGDHWATGLILNQFAWLERDCENWERAYSLADEASQIAEEMGHWHSLGSSLHLLAQIAHKRGDLERARQLYQETRRLFTEMGNERVAAELQAQLDELRPHLSLGTS
jgi:hypothetical protein